MRPTTLAIFAFLALVLDLGLAPLLNQPLGMSAVGRPSFLLIVMVYVAASAPSSAALWSALVLGLLADLCQPYDFGEPARSVSVLGPTALGYLAGAAAVMQLRGLVFRQSPWAWVILVFVGGLFANLVVVALLTLRGVGFLHSTPVAHFSAAEALVDRFFTLLYTALLAAPLGAVLSRTERLWGFATGHRRP